MLASLLGLCAINAGFAVTAQSQVPDFSGVGDLAGGAVMSRAVDLSADGLVVVGTSESAAGPEAFVWTAAGGLQGLGFLSGATNESEATGISNDGLVVVGSSLDSGGGERAVRWLNGGLALLNGQGCSNCDPATSAQGVSGDGLVVVGSSVSRSSSTAPVALDAVRWPGGGVGLADLGNLPGPLEVGTAIGVSDSGGVIAGNHLTANGRDAFYWQGAGLVTLPTLIGGSVISANALAVADDGSVIVGHTNAGTVTLPGGSVGATDPQAVRWSGPGFTTLTSLGTIAGSTPIESQALGVSANGTQIVGRIRTAETGDRAFIWDSVSGMRDLNEVLVSEYGLPLSGWTLTEARGITESGPGETTIVGTGTNPSGDAEGWVAVLVVPRCRDGIDNDGDGDADFPADTGCQSAADWSETFDCEDGLDNDGDGSTDFSSDLGCYAPEDGTEAIDCSDGIDNDGDGSIDFPADAGCLNGASGREDPACSNGLDDDGNGDFDFPMDAGCLFAGDRSEGPDCSDGLDNDDDGLFDFPADPECTSALGTSEARACSDGVDNDGNGLIDAPVDYPNCVSLLDPAEGPQCSDGLDNDGDGLIDFPADGECGSATFGSEAPLVFADGTLIVADRTSGVVFRVDRSTGMQTEVTRGGRLTSPQGLAQRGLEIVVADPAGLIAVDATGAQRLASPPLEPKESLQVVVDNATGDAFVLESQEISRIAWSSTELGSKSTWLAIPTPGVFAVLGDWDGDALAQEAGGDLLVTGTSLFSDGAFRISSTQEALYLAPGFDSVRWVDLAVEAEGSILAVGQDFGAGTQGLYRIDPATGIFSNLNTTHGWISPSAVAVDATGTIFVADAGTCTAGTCVGGSIATVDPGSGSATTLSTSGYIEGEMDLVLLPEPGLDLALGAGALGLFFFGFARGRQNRKGRRECRSLGE